MNLDLQRDPALGVEGGRPRKEAAGQSDAQHERQFEPGAARCRLDLAGAQPRVRTLLENTSALSGAELEALAAFLLSL